MDFVKNKIKTTATKVNPYERSVNLSVLKLAAKIKNTIWIAKIKKSAVIKVSIILGYLAKILVKFLDFRVDYYLAIGGIFVVFEIILVVIFGFVKV